MSESHSAWEAEIAALKARVKELEEEGGEDRMKADREDIHNCDNWPPEVRLSMVKYRLRCHESGTALMSACENCRWRAICETSDPNGDAAQVGSIICDGQAAKAGLLEKIGSEGLSGGGAGAQEARR